MYLSDISVVGLARDVEQTVEAEVSRFHKQLSKKFDKVNFFVVESDSNDSTVERLSKLKSIIPNFFFVSLGNLEDYYPNRVERLRLCRNEYVDWLRSHSLGEKILIVDFDIKSRKFNSEQLINSCKKIDEWDGIFANQAGRYYDIYALRHPEWCPTDCLEEYKIFRNYMGIEDAKRTAIWSRMRKISKADPPIEVQSAFGGLAVYKRWVFEELDYSIETNSIIGECEHVTLNRKIIKNGGRLWIDPSFVNFSWNPMNLSYYPIFRKIDRLGKSSKLRSLRMITRKLLS